mmetsp:Transcript_24119/g.33071  ORF Transcript_24119/g.33071 Transcript_24119/m.33071 type:complete len:219 (+) Transcript_24119:1147-1803(+)
MQMQTLPNTSIEVFVNSLTAALQGLVCQDSSFTSCEFTRFHAPRVPSISIRQYVERIVSYAPCTVECFVVALIYLDRIIQNQSPLFVNSRTIHRLFITSVLLSAKYIDDIYFNNKYYARVGGISGSEMNALELEFLFRVKFDCNTSSEQFDKFSHILYEPETVIPGLDLDSLTCYSVSPHTHSFMFPSCGKTKTDSRYAHNDRSRAPQTTYRRPMVTF